MAKHLFIIGAQRSGTTYLYKILDSHPGICMAKPIRPEPKYFLDPKSVEAGYESYLHNIFGEASKASWFGEKSTSYMDSEKAAHAIKQVIPDATIIVMLRNPVDRAISHYCFSREHRLEPYDDIERAFREEPQRGDTWRSIASTSVNPFAYIERGKYAQYLEPWDKLFGRDRLIVLVAERFLGKEGAIGALYERLGVCRDFVPPDLHKRVNARLSEDGGCMLSAECRTFLSETFSPWNRILARRYGLDLTCWEAKA